MTLEDVFVHDPLPTNHLFDGDFTSATPDNSKPMAQLVAHLIDYVGVGIGESRYIML